MLLVLAALSIASAARAQVPVTELGLEELMRLPVERVFGASVRLQPVTEAPSSITIVTSEEIARHGYRTLADVLRHVRGMYVSNDRNYSYLGTRGFARAGDYNTRVLLLVNGHRVNDNVYDQASIGAEFGIDPALFDRIEIIRGPASSLYGTSAFFAVVNVITRSGASINGATFDASTGSLGSNTVRGTVGRRLQNGVDFALSGTYERSDGMRRLYFPAFDSASTNDGIAEDLDGEHVGEFYAHLNFKDVTFTGSYGSRHKDVPTASFETLFDEQTATEKTTDQHLLIDSRYEHAFGRNTVAMGASFDRYKYDGLYPFASENPVYPVLINSDAALGVRLGVHGRVTRPLPGRQTLTIGAEYVNNLHQDQWSSYNDPDVSGLALYRSSKQGAVYAQNEVKVRRWLLFDLGLRYDTYAAFHRTTPRGALIVVPSAGQSIKYLYGRAFRAPNAYELYYYGTNTDAELRPETVNTHELVWEKYSKEWLRTSVSTYWYRASQLIVLNTVDPDLFQSLGFVNEGAARSRGLELEAEISLKTGVRAEGSYSFQNTVDQATGLQLTNSPRHMVKMQLTAPGPLPRSIVAVDVQTLSRRGTLSGNTVAGYAVMGATFTAPIGKGLDFVGGLRNLFNQRYADPASEEHTMDSIEQNGRTLQFGVRWTLKRATAK